MFPPPPDPLSGSITDTFGGAPTILFPTALNPVGSRPSLEENSRLLGAQFEDFVLKFFRSGGPASHVFLGES